MKLYVVPFGGLGNRLRVLNSANEIQKLHPVKIYLIWLVKSELNISLNKLFKDVGFPFRKVKGLAHFIFLKLFKHSFINKYDTFYRFIALLFFDAVIFDKDVVAKSEAEILQIILTHKKVLIATCYEFHNFKDFNNYQLQTNIQQKVDTILNDFGAYTFGVHIRRTDHVSVQNESPLEAYYEKIAYYCSSNPTARFFLATDDLEVKKHLQKQYKEQIITQETPLLRSSEEGMIGAVVDIYCLAATKLIICNTNSSFAKMASLIGAPKEIIEVR